MTMYITELLRMRIRQYGRGLDLSRKNTRAAHEGTGLSAAANRRRRKAIIRSMRNSGVIGAIPC